MKEDLKINIKGKVKIQVGDKTVLDRDNDIQAGAVEIVRRAISNQTKRINTIVVKDGATELYEKTIPLNEISFPSTGVVRFSLNFSMESFSGTFDTLEMIYHSGDPLGPSPDVFSILTGFTPIEKTSDNSMLIIWEFTITIT